MIRASRTRGLLLLLLPFTLLAAGCGVEVTSHHGAGLADLEVTWSIEGSTSPVYCSDFYIDRWLVEVRGPEDVDVFIDCRDEWATYSDLYGLFEGYYSVYVSALDPAGFVITELSSSIDLFDTGFVEVLDFRFFEGDFL